MYVKSQIKGFLFQKKVFSLVCISFLKQLPGKLQEVMMIELVSQEDKFYFKMQFTFWVHL